MAWKDRIRGRSGQRVLAGTNLVIYTAVVVAIVVLVNWFVDRHDHRWDLTPSKRYSLSPQSQKLLKDLDRDVTIYVFDRERSFGERRDALGMYSTASRRVTVRYVDPDRQPGLAKQYGVRTYGTIVVTAGDRHFEAQGDTEEGITNALIRVLKGQKTAYFIQGHGERDIDSSDRGGYDRIKKALESENNQIKPLVLMQKLEIPADCSLLVIAGPRNDYLQPEVDAIKKYVSGGGRLLMLLDPGTDLPNLTKLLADWNVTLHNDLVVDLNPVAQIFGTEPTMPLVVKYGSNPIVQPLARMATLFPFARSMTVGKEYKAGVTVDSLAETSAESFGYEDFDPKMRQVSLSFRNGKDIKGPLSLAVAGTLTGEGAKKSEGRFVAAGTSSLAANAYLGFQGNRDLFMNMVNWLSAEEDLISIRPQPPESQHLNMTSAQMREVFWLGVVGVPLLIVMAGTIVWWERR
jgi:gliding motility-associatede transport system auxiliary component